MANLHLAKSRKVRILFSIFAFFRSLLRALFWPFPGAHIFPNLISSSFFYRVLLPQFWLFSLFPPGFYTPFPGCFRPVSQISIISLSPTSFPFPPFPRVPSLPFSLGHPSPSFRSSSFFYQVTFPQIWVFPSFPPGFYIPFPGCFRTVFSRFWSFFQVQLFFTFPSYLIFPLFPHGWRFSHRQQSPQWLENPPFPFLGKI